FIITRTAIVGIDETEVPHLRALIKIGNARRYDLEHELGDSIEESMERDAALRAHHRRAEFEIGESGAAEIEQLLFVIGVRRDPARVRFRLARRFFQKLPQALFDGL